MRRNRCSWQISSFYHLPLGETLSGRWGEEATPHSNAWGPDVTERSNSKKLFSNTFTKYTKMGGDKVQQIGDDITLLCIGQWLVDSLGIIRETFVQKAGEGLENRGRGGEMRRPTELKRGEMSKK